MIPDENEAEENTRGTDEEAPQDSTLVKPEFDIEGWEGTTDVDFSFGGEKQE